MKQNARAPEYSVWSIVNMRVYALSSSVRPAKLIYHYWARAMWFARFGVYSYSIVYRHAVCLFGGQKWCRGVGRKKNPLFRAQETGRRSYASFCIRVRLCIYIRTRPVRRPLGLDRFVRRRCGIVCRTRRNAPLSRSINTRNYTPRPFSVQSMAHVIVAYTRVALWRYLRRQRVRTRAVFYEPIKHGLHSFWNRFCFLFFES